MANSRIHQGFWTDHDKGYVLGATVTLEANWGTQLVSAAAILVQMIGVAAWSILAFSIHQKRAGSGPRDEYDAQLQVILRNTSGADSAAWDIFSLGRRWRGHRAKALRSGTVFALVPALIYASFVVAGVFVGQIAQSDPIVLIEPHACGYIDEVRSTGTSSGMTGYNALQINVSSVSKQYARSCYGGGAGGISAISCSVYPVAALDYSVIHDQPCPIPGGEACWSDDDDATPIKLITKRFDSQDDLGINAPKDERLTFQYQTTCAPLKYSFVDSLITNRSTSGGDSKLGTHEDSANTIYYQFGNYSQVDFNSTHLWNYSPLVRYWGLGVIGYTINAFLSLEPHNDTRISQWIPVAPFNQALGDFSVYFLAPNSVTYTEPVEGPLFRTFSTPDEDLYGGAPYVPQEDAYVITCSDQYQICTREGDRCTDVSGISSIIEFSTWIEKLGLNDRQAATYYRLATLANNVGMYSAVYGVPDSLLASTYLISPSSSNKLPNNQWAIEVEGWFQTVLSRTQLVQTAFPDNPRSIFEQNDVVFISAKAAADEYGPQAKDLARQCHQQRVRAPQEYQSYNLFALILIVILGVLVPGAAIITKKLHHRLPGIDHRGVKYTSYQGESLLQLHRQALEGAGYRGWAGGVSHDPRTPAAEKRLPQIALERSSLDGNQLIARYPRAGKERNDDGQATETKAGYEAVAKDDTDTYS